MVLLVIFHGNDPLSSTLSRARLFGAVFLFVMLAAGCSAPPLNRPDMSRAVGDATGVDGLVFEQFGADAPATAPSPASLTMEAAVRRCLQTSPDVRAAIARVRAAEADAEQARLLPNPILSVAFRFPTSGSRPVIEAGLAEDLVSVLRRPGQIEAADDRLRGATAEALTTVLNAAAQVQDRYVAVQSLNAILPVLQQQKSLIGRLLDVARSRLQQGEGTSLDVTVLEGQRLDLEVETAENLLELRREQLALSNLIGEPRAAAEWIVDTWQPPAAIAADERTLVAAALDRRPEVAAQRWELAALGVEVRLSRFAPFEGADVGAASERDDVWTFGPAADAPIPLFDWGSAKRARAIALRAEAQQNLVSVQRAVIQDVRTALAEYTATTVTAELAAQQLLPLQERRRAQTESAYRAGQLDITALILADQQLQATTAKLIELQQKSSLALIRLERSVGGVGVGVIANRRPTTQSVAAEQSAAPASQPSTR